MAASQIKAIAATTVTEMKSSPFLRGNAIHYSSVPGATLYGANYPGADATGGKAQRWNGNGTKFQWDETELENLANADSGALSGGSILRVIVKKNGVLLTRVGPTAAPTATQFSVSANARGIATIVFDDLPTDADIITIDDGTNTPTVFEFDPAGDGVTGGRTEVDTDGDTLVTEVAAAFAAAVNGVTTTLTVTARDNGDGSVTLFSDTAGEIADLGVTTSNATDILVTNFAGDADDGVTLLFGAAPAAGDKLELFLIDAADIASATLAANIPKEVEGTDLVYASAACQAIRLTR
jgi:hypothetical protein